MKNNEQPFKTKRSHEILGGACLFPLLINVCVCVILRDHLARRWAILQVHVVTLRCLALYLHDSVSYHMGVGMGFQRFFIAFHGSLIDFLLNLSFNQLIN